ncbi:NADH dehydrogenase [ubiquinone] 1 alpha subcomplex assembly factor 2-like [Polyodon spathula]|uniref:NADH dehydrogenase [ubiquinone] 1 alpha subcomplex assembly factor 2-like n=1 Tax=Polyodon spathula TaxID=7913 RepID=UPI001B7ED9D3|nr:NADH dehydrogenase [ubiquinone] 1 alpha subcomplex assembly factor 2-like [Polyodon spathula]
MSKTGALLRRTFGIVKQHMGTDTLGNKYYYIPEQKTWTGRTIRAKRLMEPVSAKEYEYQEGSIPSEWDGNAWIMFSGRTMYCMLWRSIIADRVSVLMPKRTLMVAILDINFDKLSTVKDNYILLPILKKKKQVSSFMVLCLCTVYLFFLPSKELVKNDRYREQIKFRAKVVEEKEILIQANEYEEGLVARLVQTKLKDMPPHLYYREEQLFAEPSSTANTFQPGSWTPPKDQSTRAPLGCLETCQESL